MRMFEKKLAPVSLDHVQIRDKFWKGYMELVRNHVIPYQWEALNDRIENAQPSYCIQNFRVAAGLQEGTFQGMVFQDSDVYKWLEAVAWSLMWHPDSELEKTADETIERLSSPTAIWIPTTSLTVLKKDLPILWTTMSCIVSDI